MYCWLNQIKKRMKGRTNEMPWHIVDLANAVHKETKEKNNEEKKGAASLSKSAYWCTRQSTAWHYGIWTRCAFQFPPFPTFLSSVPLLVVIWSYQNKATTRQPGFCVAGPVAWNSLPVGIRSAPTLLSKTCSRHIFFLVPTLLDNFPEYKQRTLYGAIVWL